MEDMEKEIFNGQASEKKSEDLFLGHADWLFSRALTQEDNLAAAYLFHVSRNGFLALSVDMQKQEVFPDFTFFSQEASEADCAEKQFWEKAGRPEKLKARFFQDLKKLLSLHGGCIAENPQEDFSQKPLVLENGRLFLNRSFFYKKQIVKNLNRLQKTAENLCRPGIFQQLENHEELSSRQKTAIRMVLKNNLTFIWGGPGTGKTHTAAVLTGLLDRFALRPLRILALAPTGKAALQLKKGIEKKVKQSSARVKVAGSTIHAALKLHPQKDTLLKQQPPLLADLIFVDEISMVDARLLACLLNAVKDQTRLVFLGDLNQLPPVENIDLQEFFTPFALQSVVLAQKFRFQSADFQKTLEALENRQYTDFLKSLDSYTFISSEKVFRLQQEIADRAFEVYRKLLQGPDIKSCLSALKRFKLLSALKVGALGTGALNAKIREKFSRASLSSKAFAFPIVITQNDYRRNLFNGETGIFFDRAGYFYDGEGGIRRIPAFLLPSYELAYALSVHKSQGSEYDRIFLVLPEKSEKFGFRLLYTAATRAKEKISLFAFEKSLVKLFN